MKKSKQAKAPECEDGVDMISNLPDPVLRLILSRLQGSEEVIRTSILSRRWRYLWTSVPSIDIDYSRRLKPSKIFKKNKFKDFVYWVLLNKTLDLDNFRLWCSNYYNMSTIRQWIHVAVMRKVKLLDLMFCSREASEDIEVPHCLVTCSSLEVLRLCLFGCSLCLPKITGFPALRVLELNDVGLDNCDLAKYFLESFPLLEDLSLIDCIVHEFQDPFCISSTKLKNLRIETHYEDDGESWYTRKYSTIEISCPKLVFLKLAGNLATFFRFGNLYSLKEAVIHITDLYEAEETDTFEYFDEISHVEYLSINIYCIRTCFDPTVDISVSLPNLKTLEQTVDAYNFMNTLIPILTRLPDLESLHLIIPKDAYVLKYWKLDDAETMRVLTRHLKKVKFLEFDEEKPKLDLAHALLEHGHALEEMVFSWVDETRFHEKSMETMNQLSEFHKASSSVKLRCIINPSQANSNPAQNILEIDSIQVESSSCSSNSSVKLLGP